MAKIEKTNYTRKWQHEMEMMSKLEMYKMLNPEILVKDYVKNSVLTRKQRSVISLALSGTLPIEIEKGRWRQIPRENRICKQCDSNEVEDLIHFLVKCEKNERLRMEFYDYVTSKDNVNMNMLSDHEKVTFMLTNNDSHIMKKTANFIIMSMKDRH